MKVRLLLVVALLTLSSAVAAEERQRDWTIERPVLAGFLTGLSLTMCRSCRLGSSSVKAGEHDPFAMTPMVRSELLRLAERPFVIGRLLGFVYAIVIVGGIFFWRLNRLKETNVIGLRV